MLESSLKGLQTDLAEYIQLKNRFEEVQREKEDFEQAFQRKIKFFDDENSTNTGQEAKPLQTSAEITNPLHPDSSSGKGHKKPLKQQPAEINFPAKKNTLADWLGVSHATLLNAVFILIAIVLVVLIVQLIPWEYLHPVTSFSKENTTPKQSGEISPTDFVVEEPDFGASQQEETKEVNASSEPSPNIQLKTQQASQAETPGRVEKTSQRARAPSQNTRKTAKQTAQTRPTKQRNKPRRIDIVVQLPSEKAGNFFPQEQESFPTIENNSVLRRYAKQKLSSRL